MNKELEEKANKLLKSLYKSVKKVSKKNAIDDVLDSNNVAEMSPDSVQADTTSVMAKGKTKKLEKCKDKKDCDCECDGPEEEIDVQKSEQFIGDIMENFKMISDIYLEKKEGDLEKHRMATFKETSPVRQAKDQQKIGNKYMKIASQNYKDMEAKAKKDKEPKVPSEKDLEYPKMAASEKVK